MAEGKQKIVKGTDCGAHTAFQKAAAPPSVKNAADRPTKYKHR